MANTPAKSAFNKLPDLRRGVASSRKVIYLLLFLALMVPPQAAGLQREKIKYGDMNSWVSRQLKESFVLGGKTKILYEIGPEVTISKNVAYSNLGGSPWATSNVYAKVAGVTKGSNAVYPVTRAGADKAVKMASQLESIKVLGTINMKVMVAGTIFLGRMIEPVSSTSDPYSKMEMGIAFNRRPSAIVFDYKVDMPATDHRIKSTGFGSQKTIPGRDCAVMFVLLQRRWEDADGNLYAKRVATGAETFTDNVPAWINAHKVPLHYGDASTIAKYSWLPLKKGENAYYAYNSKGKLKKVEEVGWDSPEAVPTHMIMLFSAGNSEPYIGTPGLNFYVDNVAIEY